MFYYWVNWEHELSSTFLPSPSLLFPHPSFVSPDSQPRSSWPSSAVSPHRHPVRHLIRSINSSPPLLHTPLFSPLTFSSLIMLSPTYLHTSTVTHAPPPLPLVYICGWTLGHIWCQERFHQTAHSNPVRWKNTILQNPKLTGWSYLHWTSARVRDAQLVVILMESCCLHW